MVAKRGLAERGKRLPGGAHETKFAEKSFPERPEIETVKWRRQPPWAKCFRSKRQKKRVRGFGNGARAGLQEALSGVGDVLDGVFRVEAKRAESFGDQDVAAFWQPRPSRVFANQRDAIAHGVGFDQLRGHIGDLTHLQRIDAARSRLHREE